MLWHKATIRRIRLRFGMSKDQMLWINVAECQVIGEALAFMFHRLKPKD